MLEYIVEHSNLTKMAKRDSDIEVRVNEPRRLLRE